MSGNKLDRGKHAPDDDPRLRCPYCGSVRIKRRLKNGKPAAAPKWAPDYYCENHGCEYDFDEPVDDYRESRRAKMELGSVPPELEVRTDGGIESSGSYRPPPAKDVDLCEPVRDDRGEILGCAWNGCEKDAVVKLADIAFPQLCQEHFVLVRDEDDPAGMREVEVSSVEYRDGKYRALLSVSDREADR